MANTLLCKRSSVASKVPTTSDLALGEIGINTYDGKMYIKKDDGTASIVEVGAVAGSGVNADTLDGYHAGDIVNVVTASTSSLFTITNVMPYDDTIPQNTEGSEIITVSITPRLTTSRLIVTAVTYLDGATMYDLCLALFKDTTANAIAAGSGYGATGSHMNPMVLQHEMQAGTTATVTFKLRAGPGSSGTVYVNGDGGRNFGGVANTRLTVMEILN